MASWRISSPFVDGEAIATLLDDQPIEIVGDPFIVEAVQLALASASGPFGHELNNESFTDLSYAFSNLPRLFRVEMEGPINEDEYEAISEEDGWIT